MLICYAGSMRLAIQLERMGGKIAHHEIKNLVNQVIVDGIDIHIFQDQLPVDHLRESFTER